jgi:hypothetical protein
MKWVSKIAALGASTKLMWAGKDDGKDVNWHSAIAYCQKLRLAAYSVWRLATLAELHGTYNRSASAYGLAGPGQGRVFPWYVKANLFLTGDQSSASQRLDDRGRSSGLAWYFDFNEGRELDDDANRIIGHFASYGMRALCVRRSGE